MTMTKVKYVEELNPEMTSTSTMTRARNVRSLIVKLCWLVTLAGVAVGGFVGFVSIASASGAPQEAAGAAIACLIVIGPYVFTRGIEGLLRE